MKLIRPLLAAPLAVAGWLVLAVLTATGATRHIGECEDHTSQEG